MTAQHAADRDGRSGPRRLLLLGVAALVAVLAFGLVLPVFLMWSATPGGRVVPEPDPLDLPPEPRLQRAPAEDYRQHLERQRARLDDWQVTGNGQLRIPVEVAIGIMAERGGWRDEQRPE